MGKHIKLFEGFVNEISSGVYHSAADKMGEYSTDRATSLRDMGYSRESEEKESVNSEQEEKFIEIKNNNSGDSFKRELEAYIVANLEDMEGIFTRQENKTDYSKYIVEDIAINFSTDEPFSLHINNSTLMPYFEDAVLKTDKGYVNAELLFGNGALCMTNGMSRKMAKYVFDNYIDKIDVLDARDGKEEYDGPVRSWRELWDGKS